MALNNVISRSISGTSVFSVSVVEETEPKEYQNRFFMFIKGVPGIKSDNSPTGRSYDMTNAVTFKVDAEKALAMSFALQQLANGKGKSYDDAFGSYTIFADMSKSQYGTGGKKSLSVKMGSNKDGKGIINIFLTHDTHKVTIFLTAYEAYGAGKVIEYLALKCIEYELQGPGMVVKKQNVAPIQRQNRTYEQQYQEHNQNMYSPPPQNSFQQPPPKFQQPGYTPTPADNKNINQVTNNFSNIFSGDDPFGV